VSESVAEPFGHPKGVVAVLDTSVLVRAWLSSSASPNPSRRVMLLAGVAYDSFTSPAILDEVEEVLARPRFGADPAPVRRWLDIFLRSSRQVFPDVIPGGSARAVGGDAEDLPVLKTAYAVAAAGEELGDILVAARADGGWLIVSENTRHFIPGRNVHGWRFITGHAFLLFLHGRGDPAA
jgi:predicted nucleic acid-binding protein